jgi:hypothetical protein
MARKPHPALQKAFDAVDALTFEQQCEFLLTLGRSLKPDFEGVSWLLHGLVSRMPPDERVRLVARLWEMATAEGLEDLQAEHRAELRDLGERIVKLSDRRRQAGRREDARDAEIVRLHEAGQTYKQLARRFDMDPDAVRKAYHRKRRPPTS